MPYNANASLFLPNQHNFTYYAAVPPLTITPNNTANYIIALTNTHNFSV